MTPTRIGPAPRLVIVVRADPVICGHSGEARHLAEAAMRSGFAEVRILTWPLDTLTALPLKPLESVLPYGEGITVERPAGVGDYKVPDGRYTAGMVGRLVELFTDGVPTVCMSLYLTPHASVVMEAMAVTRALGAPVDVTTIAEAVGSDITGVVRNRVEDGHMGAAVHVFASYLGHDHCVAVSEYTKACIVDAAEQVDAAWGTSFAEQCRRRVAISYPAVDGSAPPPAAEHLGAVLALRGLERNGYVLFLSRVTAEKGVDDLIDAYERSEARHRVRLVIAGTGKVLDAMRARAAATSVSDRITFLDDVGDGEKAALMAGCAAFALPSKPQPDFVETFGITLVEKMLAGGGRIITTATGGIPEAVGDTAAIVPVNDPEALAEALDREVIGTGADEADRWARRAREFAQQFDRLTVFSRLLAGAASGRVPGGLWAGSLTSTTHPHPGEPVPAPSPGTAPKEQPPRNLSGTRTGWGTALESSRTAAHRR